MTGILQALLASVSAAVSAVTDEYFEYVTMLLPGNGTNGAQNNTFLDSSTNNFTITRNGNTTQGTFSPYGDNWSNYFDGTGDYLSAPDNAAFDFGSGDFTFEAWVYTTAFDSSYNVIASQWPTSGTNAWIVRITSTYIGFVANISGTQTYDFSTTVNLNEWMHICFTRSGTTLTAYKNGVQVGATQTITGTISNGTGSVTVGVLSDLNNTTDHTGYISNLRVVKGTAVYTAAFTPPTAPLTAITNTSLLTCQSNRFIDNSTNAFAITVNGNTSVQRFSPFSPTAAYASGTIGGSGYFDGTGDYLSGPTNTATAFNLTGDFTIECWAYFNSVATSFAGLVSWADSSGWNGWQFLNNAGTLQFEFLTGSSGAGTVTSSITMTTGRWYHLAVVRSSSTITLYIDGVSRGTSTYSSSQTSSSSFIKVGADRLASALVTGYISNLRVVNGTAVYTAGFTPPTSPVTAITNTQLLLNYTNAGIIDNAMMNDLETVGNAQISTSVSKFGGGSMSFDGTGDALFSPYSPNLNLGSGDFTIEGWVYFSSLPSNNYVLFASYGNSTSAQRWIFGYDTRSVTSSPGLFFTVINSSNSVIVDVPGGGTSGWATGTWYHVAITRSGSSWKLFRDGTQNGSTVTDTDAIPDPTANGLNIGTEPDKSSAAFNGYIDDLRITKGVARYTANFTAPTAPFPTQ